MRNPVGGGFHGGGFDPTAMHPAVLLAGQEAGVLEHAQVLGHGGKRHRKGVGEVAHRSLPQGQSGQDRPTRGIRERGERGIQRPGMINHLVKYYRAGGPLSRGVNVRGRRPARLRP
jgi:hypothetical protein